jgi:uncharacterized protein YndB with AHSA1/START domain
MTELIKKSVEINAPKKKVWDVLLNPKFINTWTSEFSEGSHVEAHWSVGGTVLYKDKNGYGLKGKVTDNKPNELLRVEYEAVLRAGVEDYESSEFENWKGCSDTYLLSEKNVVTHLSIESTVPTDYFESFSSLWDKALNKIRELSEK